MDQASAKSKKAFVNEIQRVVGVGGECNMDDLRSIATRVNCGLGEFQDIVEDLRMNGVLMKRSNGMYQVLS